MASSSSTQHSDDTVPTKSTLTIADLRSRVFIGPLPDSFLRLTQSTSSQHISDDFLIRQQQQQQQAQHEHQIPQQMLVPIVDQNQYTFVPPHTRGRIVIKIVEAKLTKNYGFVRMDPYVRVRVGQTIFETPTSVNGGKTPTWNRTINAYLPDEVESMYLQVYDERAFTNDECVAWAHIILPDGIFNNEVIDEWYPLSGQQGEGKEGLINLIISFTPINLPAPLPVLQQHEQAQIQQQIFETNSELFTQEELNELSAMFPTIDKEVIRSVLEEKRGDKDASVTVLIEMTS